MVRISRRQLLGFGASIGAVFGLSPQWLRLSFAKTTSDDTLAPVIAGPYEYLRMPEVFFIDAAVERLIPTDQLGPGAARAGVTVFIDRQLAGPYGKASDWYMQGPWEKGTDEQGYQLEQTPAALYRAAIEAIDAHCRQTYADNHFAALGSADQDSILHALEQGDLALKGVSGKAFFTMLWKNTKEGFFSDPIYEGNRDFIGWTLVGFPGPRYNYLGEIGQYGQPYRLPPVGLAGRDSSRRLGTKT